MHLFTLGMRSPATLSCRYPSRFIFSKLPPFKTPERFLASAAITP